MVYRSSVYALFSLLEMSQRCQSVSTGAGHFPLPHMLCTFPQVCGGPLEFVCGLFIVQGRLFHR